MNSTGIFHDTGENLPDHISGREESSVLSAETFRSPFGGFLLGVRAGVWLVGIMCVFVSDTTLQ